MMMMSSWINLAAAGGVHAENLMVRCLMVVGSRALLPRENALR